MLRPEHEQEKGTGTRTERNFEQTCEHEHDWNKNWMEHVNKLYNMEQEQWGERKDELDGTRTRSKNWAPNEQEQTNLRTLLEPFLQLRPREQILSASNKNKNNKSKCFT